MFLFLRFKSKRRNCSIYNFSIIFEYLEKILAYTFVKRTSFLIYMKFHGKHFVQKHQHRIKNTNILNNNVHIILLMYYIMNRISTVLLFLVLNESGFFVLIFTICSFILGLVLGSGRELFLSTSSLISLKYNKKTKINCKRPESLNY